jgi:hypothetical protein
MTSDQINSFLTFLLKRHVDAQATILSEENKKSFITMQPNV